MNYAAILIPLLAVAALMGLLAQAMSTITSLIPA